MKNKKIISKIVDILLNVLIVLLSIFLLVSLYTAVQVKFMHAEYADFFGYSLFEVETGSMHGTIEVGDWIIVKTTKDVNRNDIITYKSGKDFITHRVIEKYKGSYVTKGDANNTKDEAIDQEQVVGKVIKILPHFGILRRIFFNPIVIVCFIICLYFFNLTFKPGKSEFDLNVEKVVKLIKDRFKKKPEKEKKLEKKEIAVPIPEEVPEEKIVEKVDPVVPKVETPVVETPIAEKIPVENPEDPFGNTAMFRMVDIDADTLELYHKAEEEIQNTPADNEEDLSKTSVFRIISVDEEEEEEEVPTIEEVVEEKENLEEEVPKTKTIEKVELEAEEIIPPTSKKVITKEYITNKIHSKKAKNLLDKTFMIKRIVYDEVLDEILSEEKSYIVKSPMRKEFLEQYMNTKYFGIESDRKNLNSIMKEFSEELKKKNIRDERKVLTVEAYYKAFQFIHKIESKPEANSYEKELLSFKKFDDETLESINLNIINTMKYSRDCLLELLSRFETNNFKDQYKKITGIKNLYGVSLKHNIQFSKVYSHYIVDKTYTEGIVSEDKLAVLLNLLLSKITTDIMNQDYESKYIVYIPSALYGKDKKLDKIVAMIENDYAKSHIFFLSTITDLIKNDDVSRLSKKGYHFALSFDQSVKMKNKDMGYVYLADYYFVDAGLNTREITKGLPKEIIDQIIIDSLDKKIGDYKGGE